MHHFPSRVLAAVSFSLLVASGACDAAAVTTEDAPAAFFAFSGTLVGTAPANSRIAMIWVINDANPDYKFKYGGGVPAAGSFQLAFDGAPPTDALHATGMGYGYLALVSADVPDGTRAESSSAFGIIGRSFEHSVVYRASTAQPGEPWAGGFQNGYGCGVCRRVAPTSGNDQLDPTSCSSISITIGNGSLCNLN